MSKSIKLNTVFKTLMSIINILFPLLTAPYVARVLSVDGYTEYNRALNMVLWFSPFAVFGVYTYGMRTISQIRDDKIECAFLFSRLFLFNIFTSIVTSCIFLLVVLLGTAFQGYKLLYITICLQLLCSCFATDWFNEAFEDYGFILTKTFLCKVLYVISVFIFVQKESDVYAYVVLSSIFTAVNNVLTFLYAKKQINFVKIAVKDIIKLIKPLFLIFLLVNSSMLYTIFDRFVLMWFGNKLQLTYYTISQTIVTSITNVTSSVVLVSIPRLSHLWATGENVEYYKILDKSSSAFLALQTPCCIGMALLASEIMWLYSGNNYLAGSITLCFFSLRYYLSAFDIIQAKQVLLATGNERKLTKIYYIAGICNIILKITLLLIGKLSPELCIVTTAMSDILVLFLEHYEIKKLKIQFNFISRTTRKYFITSLLFVPVVLGVKLIVGNFYGDEIILRTVLSVFFCSLIYAFVLIISKDNFIYSIPLFNKILRRKSV